MFYHSPISKFSRNRYRGVGSQASGPVLAWLLTAVLLTSVLLTLAPAARAADVELPALGDASSALISSQQEYELGQKVLKLYRSHVPTSQDPLIYSYLHRLITDLAQHSELNEKSFDLIVIEAPSINAFAVPGRIIGVHTGIFLDTDTEDQLASILSHELAHLSQRHYARQIEAQKNAAVPTLAGLLAGILLAASGSADAGMAAITATQAAALDNRLRFSRLYEQEADRVGMKTMVDAGRNPEAAAEMFEIMLREARFSRSPPEFLSTHPVTESRISDARNRAMQLNTEREYPDNLEFQLMAARVKLHYSATPQEAAKRFRSEIQGETNSREASQYGLVLALTAAGDIDQAREAMAPLLENRPDSLIYALADAQIDARAKDYNKALNALNRLLKQYPDDHGVNIQFAEVLMEAGEHDLSRRVLERYVRTYDDNDYAWYLLAEVQGLLGNILEVHKARAEYFILNGIYDSAETQLRNALRMVEPDSPEAARLEQRLVTVRELRASADF